MPGDLQRVSAAAAGTGRLSLHKMSRAKRFYKDLYLLLPAVKLNVKRSPVKHLFKMKTDVCKKGEKCKILTAFLPWSIIVTTEMAQNENQKIAER